MTPSPTELRKRGDSRPDNIDELPQFQEVLDVQTLDPNRKHVGVDGKWYDVTDFISRHPGGPVIEQFIGQDATTVFHAYGHENVLKYRKPVGTYQMPKRHPADEDFEKLRLKFTEMGFFKTDYNFYYKKFLVCLALISTVFTLVIGFDQWYLHYLAAVVLAFFWQQCGFIMHEFMHTQVVRKRIEDRAGGVFFGTFCFGFSAHWWQDEHIIHHAMTNTVDAAKKFADPQMWENAWAQHEKMYPLFAGVLQYMLIKIQHFTFIPFVVGIGRFEIITDSYRLERRWYEWIAIVGHWIWMVFLLSHLPTWKEVIIFYLIAAWVEGIFHFQLILSHYAKLFITVDEFHKSSWYVYMVLSNMNIDVPWWQDWYYGGLNFHIEHHLYPKMARQHLREAGKYVKEVCDKHNIDYDMCYFYQAMWKTLVSLKKAGSLYSIDPR